VRSAVNIRTLNIGEDILGGHAVHRIVYSVEDFLFYRKLGVLGLILFFSGMLALSRSPLLGILGIGILGAMFAHMVELQHQCLHYTAFKRRILNRFVGVLLGLPMLVSFSPYQALHFRHHKAVGTKEDTEFFDREYFKLELKYLLQHLFDLKRIFNSVSLMFKSWLPNFALPNASKIATRKAQQEYQIMSLVLTILAWLSFYFHSGIIFRLWLIPLTLVSQPVHFLIELPEHFGCESRSKEPHLNTRTVKGSWFSFWFTNGNNFHVEHHARPSLPIDQLPQYHDYCSLNLEYLNNNYFEFYRGVFMSKWSK